MKTDSETLEKVAKTFISLSAHYVLNINNTDKSWDRVNKANALYSSCKALAIAAKKLRNQVLDEEGIGNGN